MIYYRVHPSVLAEPKIQPQEALDVASKALRPSHLAGGVCSDWHLFFHNAWRKPQLAYACRVAASHYICFSAIDGKLIVAKAAGAPPACAARVRWR